MWKIKKSRETSNLKDFYRKYLDKACFAHDVADSESKYLVKRTISDNILKGRAYEIARNPWYEVYQRALWRMYKSFDKKTGSAISVNEHLVEELHKPVTKKFKRRKICAIIKDNIWL